MERPSRTEQTHSFHQGYYDVPSFDLIRLQIQAGDQLSFKTLSKSVYTFVILAVEHNTRYGPFMARGTLIDAPHKVLHGENDAVLRTGEECYIQVDGTNQPLKIFFDAPKGTRGREEGTVVVTTSLVTSYGLQKSN